MDSNSGKLLIKMQQAYWEVKRNLGKKDDEWLTSNDSQLDAKVELLHVADKSLNDLMRVLLNYNKALRTVMAAEEDLGKALIEYGIKDRTKAGKMMSICGMAISRSSSRWAPLKTVVIKLFYEVQTFQLKATVDAFQTVARMEKVRRSYRSGLLWMRNVCQSLDPDDAKKLRIFRRVQEHVKSLKVRYDEAKLVTMQKIDLYLFSRCNLFSQSLVPYKMILRKMSKGSMILMRSVLQKIPDGTSFALEDLKHLNEYSTSPRMCLECQLCAGDTCDTSKDCTNKRIHPELGFKCAHSPNLTISQSDPIHSNPLPEISVFQNPLEESPSNKTLKSSQEPLLINLNADTQSEILYSPKMSLTPERSLQPGEYSIDLLSLDVNYFLSGCNGTQTEETEKYRESFGSFGDFIDSFDTFSKETESSRWIGSLEHLETDPLKSEIKIHKDLLLEDPLDSAIRTEGTEDFRDGFETTMELLDSFDTCSQETECSDQLPFWSLMKNSEHLKSTPLTPENKMPNDVTLKESGVKRISHWEEVIDEFDPCFRDAIEEKYL